MLIDQARSNVSILNVPQNPILIVKSKAIRLKLFLRVPHILYTRKIVTQSYGFVYNEQTGRPQQKPKGSTPTSHRRFLVWSLCFSLSLSLSLSLSFLCILYVYIYIHTYIHAYDKLLDKPSGSPGVYFAGGVVTLTLKP